jgi:hypothetical protein
MFVNEAGCDSTLTLNLTILENISNSISETACDSYTWNGETYTTSGTYTQHFLSTSSCDSVVTLNLTIVTVNASISVTENTLSATQSGASYQWFNCTTGQNITGATSQTFTPTQNGFYAVNITLNGCTAESSCEEITSLNTELISSQEFKVYPNPFGKEITILWSNDAIATVHVLDIQGKEIMNIHLNSGLTTLSTENLPSGIYILQVESEGKWNQVKMIK